ncbi:MAG: sigma-54-dependent Fis family transcriptional regulator [Deltaproteobacteria bacterium]|nr:sigma-54-dependent Fis family transcriptional regulator [Deltaproteobacteria bacterium]
MQRRRTPPHGWTRGPKFANVHRVTRPTPAPSPRVLIIDDEKNIRTTLAVCLESLGCVVGQASNGAEALQQVQRDVFDLAFLDLRLGAEDGLALLGPLLAERPGMQVVIITAYATVDTAVEALRAGAADYVQKPFTPPQIAHVVRRLREQRALHARVTDLETQLRSTSPRTDLTTHSPVMRGVLDMLERAAASGAPVLLRGESGTGKSLLARHVHALSARANGPFITINCPTLSEDLLASELFGHARGAFTGAVKDQPGRVEAADGGTLFLDEIGEIPPALQAKLLRFVQDREFERVGESRLRRADVRVISATNRNLEADVQGGRFREDLLYRLNVVEVTVPPLRDRPDDILPLARGFIAFFAANTRNPSLGLSPEAESALRAHAWPGNIRELRNALERAVVLCRGATVTAADLPQRVTHGSHAAPRLGGDVTLEELEQEHIRLVTERAASQAEAARILGVDTSTLWRRKKKQ